MKKFTMAAVGSAALVGALLVPAAAANAADAPVSGVVTVAGVPLAGTEVGWFDPTTKVGGETVTAADGSYSLTVASGHPYVLYAGADHTTKGAWKSLGGANYVPEFRGLTASDYLYQGLALYPAPTVPLVAQNLDLDKPATISGVVAGLDTKSVVAVKLDNTDAARVKSDANGAYTITGLIPGSYQLYVPAASNKYLAYMSPVLTLAAGTTTTVSPVLVKGATISGVVTSGGKPVSGISVTAFGGDGGYGDNTDSKGRYTIKNVPAGTFSVLFNQGPEGGYNARNPYVAKTKSVKITTSEKQKLNASLTKGGTFTAAVIGTKGATKLSVVLQNSKKVAFVGINGDPKKNTATTLKISGIKAGTYTALFTDTTGKYYAKQKVTFHNGKVTALGTVRLTKKTVTYSGKLSGATKAFIYYSSKAHYSGSSAKVKGGKYTLRGIVPGYSGSISVAADDHTAKVYAVKPTHSKKKNLTIGKPWGSIAGTFLVGGYAKTAGFGQLFDGRIEQVPGGTIYDGEGLGQYRITNGAVTGDSAPGTGNLTINSASSDNDEFVEKSPFFLSVPAAAATVTVAPGAETNIGTVELQINR